MTSTPNPNTINREVLSRKMAEDMEMSISQAREVVNFFVDTVSDALRQDKQIKLAGLGTFFTDTRKPREGRNPATGEVVGVPERCIVRFRVSPKLKTQINEGLST